MGSSTRDNFKANLKHYRKQKGLSQEKLSEIIGFGGTYITEIESRHKFPKPETIDIIAQNLDIEPYQLFISPEKDYKQIEATQVALKSVAEKISDRFTTLIHDKMVEEISDIMEQENLILVHKDN
ncbi:MAG: helix-turn-helix transcriptional regulator [Spirochaetaceae bacterium]|nr:helix-turn-helix transcriptional regulator [Spirochaetaceae bacterium]